MLNNGYQLSCPGRIRGRLHGPQEGAVEKPHFVRAARAVTSASPGEKLWSMMGKAMTSGKAMWPWCEAVMCSDNTPNSSSGTTIAVTAARAVTLRARNSFPKCLEEHLLLLNKGQLGLV